MFLAAGGTDVFVLICQSNITGSTGVVNSQKFHSTKGTKRFHKLFDSSVIYTHVLEKSEIKREMIQLTVDRLRNVAYPHSILTGCTVSYSHPPSSFSSDTPACRLCTSSAGFNNDVFLTPSSILEKYNYIKVLKSGTNLMNVYFINFLGSILRTSNSVPSSQQW